VVELERRIASSDAKVARLDREIKRRQDYCRFLRALRISISWGTPPDLFR